MPHLVTLHLTLDKPKPIPAPYKKRWKTLVKTAGHLFGDAPYLIFLGELLSLLDNDPAPQFSSACYSDVDMFGGRDQDWTIATHRARIHRAISQSISESWQRVEVEADVTQITGLPDDIFIGWDGDWAWGMNLVIGNIDEDSEAAILKVAKELFAKVEHRRSAASTHGKVRADLKRDYRSVGAPARSVAASELESLCAALEDQDSDVGVAALERLEAFGLSSNPRVQEALLSALKNGHWIVRQAVAEALGMERDRRNVAPLVEALSDQESGVREAAVEALGRLGDPQAVPALLPLLQDSWFRVRWVTVAALGKLVSPETADLIITQLIPLLGDENRYVRSATVSVLAEFSDPRLVEPFIECLQDHNEWIRQTATYALGKLGDRRAVDGLTGLLEDSDKSVQAAAAEALARLSGS